MNNCFIIQRMVISNSNVLSRFRSSSKDTHTFALLCLAPGCQTLPGLPRAKRAARLLPPPIFNDIFLNVKMGRNVCRQAPGCQCKFCQTLSGPRCRKAAAPRAKRAARLLPPHRHRGGSSQRENGRPQRHEAMQVQALLSKQKIEGNVVRLKSGGRAAQQALLIAGFNHQWDFDV